MTHGLDNNIFNDNQIHVRATHLIDKSTIESYSRLGKARDYDVLELILNKYLLYSNGAVEELQKKIARLEYRSVEEMAHSLKSSSAQVGALELSSLYEQIEKCAEKRELEKLTDNFFQNLVILQRDVAESLAYIIENVDYWLHSDKS